MLPYASLQEAETAIGRSLTRVETLWFTYTSNKSHQVLYYHNIPLVFLLPTLIPLFYLFMELMFPNYVASYKLQPNIKFSLHDKFKCHLGVMRTLSFTAVPMLLVSYPVMKMIGIRTSLPLPSPMEVISQLIIYFVIDDYANYWIHRFSHVNWMYEKIHKVHHEYTAPMEFVSLHAHWMDIFLFGTPSFLGPILVPGHMITLYLWLFVRATEAVENHSGYDFPWTIKKLIPFSVDAEYHEYHHRAGGQSHSNFAPVFTYCDYIYGTDKRYKYHKRLMKKQLQGSKGD